MEVGERIRWLRKQRNMTIEHLASKVGVTRQTISRYETGAIEDIPKSKLEKVASALDVSCDYLRGWTLDSQSDSMLYEIQQYKEMLKSTNEIEERAKIALNISVLEDAYSDLSFAQQLQSALPVQEPGQSITKPHTIGRMVREWHSDKKATLTMAIDSWLLLALKGMAADSNRSLADEIEETLYTHVMNAIEDEMNKQNSING